MDKKLRNLILSLIGLFFAAHSEAGNIDHAKMLNQHGSVDDAKRLFIEIIQSDAADADKAASLYNLGVIAFNEQQLQVAFDTWQNLVEQYPESDEGKIISERYGIGRSFKDYIGPLLATYEDFLEAFPNSDFIPLLKFQIAQAYWGHEALEAKKWLRSVIANDSTVVDLSSLYLYVETEKWLRSVIEDGNTNNSYTQVAMARLEAIEVARMEATEAAIGTAIEAARMEAGRLEAIEATRMAELETQMKNREDKLRRSKVFSIYKSDPHTISGKYEVGFKNGRFVLTDRTFTLYPESPSLTLVRPIKQFDNFHGSMGDFIKMMLNREEARLAKLKTQMKNRRDKIWPSEDFSIYKSDPHTISGKYEMGFTSGRFVLTDRTFTLYSEFPRLTLVRPIKQFDNFHGSMGDFIKLMLKDAKSDNK